MSFELSSLLVYEARPADAPALANLAERTFEQTFAESNTEADLRAYVQGAFSLSQIQQELSDPQQLYLLACRVEEPNPCGYAKLRSGSPDAISVGPRPMELQRLYVEQRELGQGVGAQLMQRCLDVAAAHGYQTLWLGVWEHNLRAIAFYEQWGFQMVGEHGFQLGSDLQTDWIMERTLASPTDR